MRRGERVPVRPRALAGAAIGHPRGEPLVIGLYGDVEQLDQLLGEGAADPGLLALLTPERGRQADDHAIRLLRRDELGDRRWVGRLDRGERPREGPGRVRNRTAAAGGAVIEGEHAQEAIE